LGMKPGESAAAQTQQYHLRTKPHDAIKLTGLVIVAK